jgi:hypothetical protein
MKSAFEFLSGRLRKTAYLGYAHTVSMCLFVCFFTCAQPAAAQTWSWTVETADSDPATFTSIIADQDGNLHVSYRNDDNFGQLKYAFRSAKNAKWFNMILDKQIGSFSTDIGLDLQGNPQICYTPRELKYALWDGRHWNTFEIAPHTGVVEYSCSVFVNRAGKRQVTWYQTHKADMSFYLHLRYAVFEDGAWQARTVDFDGEAGKWSSLVTDDEGNPHVSYSQFPNGELRYAYWNGKAWNSSIVDSPTVNDDGGREGAARGMGNCLVRNRQNQWTISYYDLGSIKYARQEGDRWSIQRVDHLVSASTSLGGWAGYRTTQVLDSHGNPHIEYEDAGAVKHAYWDGKQWQVQVIIGVSADTYRYASMAIDGQDNIYISYRDPSDGSLKVAIGHPADERATSANSTDDKVKPKP